VNRSVEIAQVLREHLALCQELLALVTRENKLFKESVSCTSPLALSQAKKALVPRLEASLEQIRLCRAVWQKKTPAERKAAPEITLLIEENQNLVQKIVLLNRENEQILLRRGLGPPPPARVCAATARPAHFVAGLYRRNSL
jgi:hypothetical protein